MNFSEAMDKLQEGLKVTRAPWYESVYFCLIDGEVKSFQPRYRNYSYDENIMISTGWFIKDSPEHKEFKFCDVISYLRNGVSVTRKDWEYSFIYYDFDEKSLIYHSMDVFPFVPDFESFIADDWMEIK